MNQFLERSLAKLGGSENIDQVEVETLERLTKQYPYFPVAQMLLAKKLKSQDNPAFLAQVQKTALYFYNPFWLHYQLLNHEPSILLTKAEPPIELKNTGKSPINIDSTDKESTRFGENDASVITKGMLEINTKPADEERVVLTDGDDNVDPEELVHGPSTLLESLDGKEEANDKDLGSLEKISADEEQHVNDIPITTEFSLEEIEQSAELAHETLIEVDEEAEKKLFALPGEHEEVEDVPITTEFTLEEIEESAELAHETLVEVDENADQQLFGLPGEELVTTDVPITTDFSLEEIEQSTELAHETLVEVDKNADEVLFALPVAQNFSELPEPNYVEMSETSEQTYEENETVSTQGYTGVVEETAFVTNNTESSSADAWITENTPGADVNDHGSQGNYFNDSKAELRESQAGAEIENKNEANTVENLATKNDTVDENTQQKHVTEVSELPKVSADSFSNAEMLKNIKAALDTPIAETKTGVNEPLIPIDPYHTVDYFASQGIKLVLEKDPKDKLGKQLKSFTQWLKHMKKVGPEDSSEFGKENDEEAKIPRIADSSNTQREVVTEAMADVLLKQGKTDKALQVYMKLSFLYPDKSAYFADQIKKIKGI